jgi:oligoribonuclease NrnB/cAMP/cGMP phosphodiesterase (DHH superfamily)
LFKILSTYADIQDYAPFVNLVNIYDTWGHGTQPTKEAKELNRLLQCIGAEAFLTRFKLSASVHLSDTEKAIINADMYREEQYIQKALDRVNVGEDPDGTFFAYVTAEQYTSSLGNAMLAQIPDVEYALILDMFNGKASLRGKGNIDVSAIAKRCGGGGHKRSAGFILDGDTTLKYFWRCASCERGRSGDPVMDEQVPVYDAASTEATQKS